MKKIILLFAYMFFVSFLLLQTSFARELTQREQNIFNECQALLDGTLAQGGEGESADLHAAHRFLFGEFEGGVVVSAVRRKHIHRDPSSNQLLGSVRCLLPDSCGVRWKHLADDDESPFSHDLGPHVPVA